MVNLWLMLKQPLTNTGQPAVSLKFNSLGLRSFLICHAELKKQFAIVLDDKIISAPVFQDIIHDGNGQISGSFYC